MGKMKGLGDKLKSSNLHDVHVKATHMKHSMGKFANIINPNHRHDEEHEKATDNKRTAIAESHRFGSFAPEREGNNVKWYVDARDYFWVSIDKRVEEDAGSSLVTRTFPLHLKAPRRPFTSKTGGCHRSW